MGDGDEPGLSFNATWSMAVGGMVGGGIFSTLGLVIAIAGAWAWLSFVTAGVIALGAGYCYVKLAARFGEGGGAFTFLREIHADGFAGSLSWVLLIGYVLTNAVYAFTFGEYLGHVVGLGPWFPRVAAVAIMALFIGLNLRGAGEAGSVEVALVWFKLAVLVGLAAWGLALWAPDRLAQESGEGGVLAALFGAGSVFMAYEGFQLLTYDYEEIRDPARTLKWAILSAIVVVIGVYVMVAIGTAMIVGADQIAAHEEVALSLAGEALLGTFGVVLVTIAAAASTGSAINSTLFATARLARLVARAGELPRTFEHYNANKIPDRAVLVLGGLAAGLAVFGSLSLLVEAASLAFLFTFAVVAGLAWRLRAGQRWASGATVILSLAALVALIVRVAGHSPWALAVLAALVLVAVFGRPWLLRHVETDHDGDSRR